MVTLLYLESIAWHKHSIHFLSTFWLSTICWGNFVIMFSRFSILSASGLAHIDAMIEKEGRKKGKKITWCESWAINGEGCATTHKMAGEHLCIPAAWFFRWNQSSEQIPWTETHILQEDPIAFECREHAISITEHALVGWFCQACNPPSLPCIATECITGLACWPLA